MWFPGIKKKSVPWEVTLWGKHRSFGDYITCGDDNRLVQQFAGWAQRDKTLSAVDRCIKNDQWISWCYWLKEGSRSFHCGVMMTSCDRSRRPNLLILAGRGEPAGDSVNWETFSLGCRKTWQAMTAIGQEEFEDLPALQARLAALPRPEKTLPPVQLNKEEAFQTAMERVRQTIQTDKARCLTDKTVFIECSDDNENESLRHQIACRQLMEITPDSFFLGGLPGKNRLRFFFRHLGESDFIQFWEN